MPAAVTGVNTRKSLGCGSQRKFKVRARGVQRGRAARPGPQRCMADGCSRHGAVCNAAGPHAEVSGGVGWASRPCELGADCAARPPFHPAAKLPVQPRWASGVDVSVSFVLVYGCPRAALRGSAAAAGLEGAAAWQAASGAASPAHEACARCCLAPSQVSEDEKDAFVKTLPGELQAQRSAVHGCSVHVIVRSGSGLLCSWQPGCRRLAGLSNPRWAQLQMCQGLQGRRLSAAPRCPPYPAAVYRS